MEPETKLLDRRLGAGSAGPRRHPVGPFLLRPGVHLLGEPAGTAAEAPAKGSPFLTFESWPNQVLSDSRKAPKVGSLDTSLPQHAPTYAKGYLDQGRDLQPSRPAAPPGSETLQYHWEYHLGRIMSWKGAGNDPGLSPGFQQGLADRRSLKKWATSPKAGRLTPG